MKYLHKDEEFFKEVINTVANELGIRTAIVEKDYYVTMILKLLAQKAPECVFKGGTSLSKCFHAIERFSEDIDIAFSEKLTPSQRKILKNEIIAEISKELGLKITDWENARSKRNYNCYTFSYEPIEGYVEQSMIQGVKMEVSLITLSFPTTVLPVDSYIYQYLRDDDAEIVAEYGLEPFEMRVQNIERTLIDKVFAICDYYLQQKESGENKTSRHSRHIYDIYKLLPRITLNDEFRKLVSEIRECRLPLSTCPSAKRDIDINALLREIILTNVYREDYDTITSYFEHEPIEYEEVISAIYQIIESNTFLDSGIKQ